MKLFNIGIFPLLQLRNSTLVSCNWKAVGKWKQSGIFSPQKFADYVVFSWKIKNDPKGKDWNSFFI